MEQIDFKIEFNKFELKNSSYDSLSKELELKLLNSKEDFNENDKFLKGFYFREDERIETIEDLFKEDLKYELIKINQLQN